MENNVPMEGAIPVDQFQAAQTPGAEPPGAMPEGAIPIDQFESSEDKYGTTEQQVKTGLEGVGKGFLGSTISNALETNLLGADPKDIEGRAEENPISSGVGQATGLGAGFVSGLGPEAMLMSKAGEAAAGLTAAGKLTGAALEAAPLASKVGSEAVKQAVEMAVLASDDEIAKKIWTHPEETADQAIANIGLSAALGGAGGAFVTGAISPLWKATVGPGVDSFLSSISSKLGGKGAEEGLAKSLSDATDVDLAKYPSVAAKIDGNELVDNVFSKLSQTDTTHYGRKVQEELANMTHEVGSKMAETLGHTPESVEGLESKVDKYTKGNEIADTLHKEISDAVKPINDMYEKINTDFKASPISSESQRSMSEQIAKKAIDSGWYKSADESQVKLMEKVLNKLPQQTTAEDLKLFITNLRENHPFGSPTYQAAKDMSSVIKDAQERSIMEGIAAKGGTSEMGQQALEQYQNLKSQYKGFMDTIDNLNEHLHVGKYYGPQSFLNNLKELGTTNAERVLKNLSGSSKADALNILQKFPETLSKVREFHVDDLLNTAKNAEGSIDPRKFSKQFDKLSPQIKDLIADKNQQQRLNSLNEMMVKTNDATHNWSNTARTTDKLTNGLVSPIALIAAAMGHGIEGIMTHLGGLGLKEGGDALRYGLLKFLGSDAPTNGPGFKSMVQMIDNTIKGESNLNKAVESVFKGGTASAISMPTASSIAKLDKIVVKNQEDPNHLNDKIVNSQTGHYLPQHQLALTNTTMKAVEYLKTIKPQPQKLSPLDKPIPPSKAQEARYNRALTIAENPNVVIQHIKDGTLQSTDVKDLAALYPTLYPKLQQKFLTQMVNMHQDSDPVPYNTRLSLGLFMATPLDSTMSPMSIMAAQPKPQQPPPQQSKPGTQKAGSAIKKASNGYKTQGQAAESDRSNRD